MSDDRLGARPDFDEWAADVVSTVKKHRSRHGRDQTSGRSAGPVWLLRTWLARVRRRIA